MRHNLRRGIHRGESSPRPAGWGTQPLRIQLRVLTFQFSCLPVHLSPLWGFRYLVYCVCYKHVAPLGLNASQFAARYPSWGEFSSPSGLGNATPTDPTSLAHVPVFVPPCSHVAPLGLNAAQFAARYPSWGEFSSPSGLGDPTPTDPTSRSPTRWARRTLPTMDTAPQIVTHLAPEGRHVYSTRNTPNT